MKCRLHWTMTHRTLEQELALNGQSCIQTIGVSMEPLLHDRKSTVTIKAKTAPLQKYDVVLYRRPAGKYVLHRIIKVLDGAYLIRGDNSIENEVVPDEWIFGVMTGYYGNEQDQYVSCESARYRYYLKTLWLRYGVLWMRNLLGYLRRKVSSLRKHLFCR